jgi:WD40 repeat protein
MSDTTAARAVVLCAMCTLLACSANPSATKAPARRPLDAKPREPAPCELARVQRDRVPGLLEYGRLDRALRVIREANRMCPSEAARTWAAEVSTLAELGMWREMRELADRLDAEDNPAAKAASARARERANAYDVPFEDSAEAKGPMREVYGAALRAQNAGNFDEAYDGYRKAWELWRPNGQALMQAGLMANRSGKKVEAQKLFDRAVVELEGVTGKKVILDATDGFSGDVKAVAWRPGVIAVAHRTYVSLIEQGTLRERARLEGHTADVTCLSFSPDGSRLASRSEDNVAKIWDLRSGEQIAGLEGDPVVYSSDGKKIASGAGGTIRVWDAASGKMLTTLKPSDFKPDQVGSVYSIAYSPDSSKLAAGMSDGVRIWDGTSGRQVAKLEGYASAVAYSPDGSKIATGSWLTIRIWDLASRRVMAKFESDAWVDSVVYSPDGTKLAVGAGDTARIWDLTNMREVHVLKAHRGDVASVAFSSDGKLLVSGSADKTIRIWDVRSGKTVATVEGHSPLVRSVTISSDGAKLAFGANDERVRLLDLKRHRATANVPGHTGDANTLSLSSDGMLLAFAADDNAVLIWDVDKGREKTKLRGHSGPVTSVAFSLDGKKLVSAGDDGSVRIWDMASGRETGRLADRGPVAFSPDGQKLVSKSRIWDAPTGREVAMLDETGDRSFAFSPDGQTIASSSRGTVRIQDGSSGRTLMKLEGHSGSVNCVAFYPDGTKLASGSDDKTIRLWEVASGRELRVLQAHADDVKSLAFSANGERMVSASDDGTVVLWRTADWSPMASIRSIKDTSAVYVLTPDGYVHFLSPGHDGPPSFPLCRIGDSTFPFETCRERFEVPGLLPMVLAEDTSYREP